VRLIKEDFERQVLSRTQLQASNSPEKAVAGKFCQLAVTLSSYLQYAIYCRVQYTLLLLICIQSTDGVSVGALQTHTVGQTKQISSRFKSEHRLLLFFICSYHPIQLWTLKQKEIASNKIMQRNEFTGSY
jgi:hypothetical protein